MTTPEEQATERGMSLLAAGVPLTLLIDLALGVPAYVADGAASLTQAMAVPGSAA